MSWVGATLKESINSLSISKSTDDTQEFSGDMDSNLHLQDIELDRGDSANRAVSIGEVGAPARFRHIKNNKYMRRLYLVLAALAAIFVFSSLLRLAVKGSNNNGDTSKSAGSSGMDIDLSGTSLREGHLIIMMHDVMDDTLDQDNLINVTSPQRQALRWMANDDPMQLEVPETRFDLSYPAFLQRYSVAVLAFAFGTDILAPLGFLTGASECEWNADYQRPDRTILKMGIICEKNQVDKVVLQTLGLSGTIPRELGHLHLVKHLHLDSNNLAGHLPHTITQMHQLREFTVTRNALSGHIPSFLGKMQQLRHIELSSNKFSGHLSAFGVANEEEATDVTASPLRVLAVSDNKLNGPLHYLNPLYVMEELYLDGNDLTGHIGEEFTDFSQLAIFTASDNKLSGKVPDYLLELPSMTILDLSKNSFEHGFPHGNATNLKYLDLHENSITGNIPNSIGSKPELVYLDISSNALTGELPHDFADLNVLQYLFLSENPNLEPSPIPDFIMELPVLQTLTLENTARTGTIPKWISKLDQLHVLDLERNDMNGTLPDSMQYMTSLEYLFLNRNQFSGDIPEALGNLSKIVLLNLDHNDLTGLMPDSVCALDINVLVADCEASDKQSEPAVECACCTKCCAESDANCNTRDWSKRYGDDWGGDFYVRYNIVEDGDVFQLLEVKDTNGDKNGDD